MNILVDNGMPELTNLGDLAMLAASCRSIRQKWPDAHIFTFATNAERLRAVLPGVSAIDPAGRELWSRAAAVGWLAETKLPRLHHPARTYRALITLPSLSPLIELGARRAEERKGAVAAFLDLLRNVDLYFWSGGGYLADPFGSLATKLANTLEALSHRGVPSAAFGLSIGPLHRARILRTVRLTMRNLAAIGVREAMSLDRLRSWSFDEANVCLTGDDAIAEAHAERPAELGAELGISFRFGYYAGLGPEHFAAVKSVLQEFCSKRRLGLVSIPIGRGDLEVNAGLVPRSVPVTVPAFELGAVYRAVARCRVVLAGCYHAAVFALSMGIPVIALAASEYYMQKFLGLQRQFDNHLAVVLLKTRTSLEAFRSELIQALARAWSGAPDLRPKLLAHAAAQIAVNDGFRGRVLSGLCVRTG